jgi:hypothetical protein
MSPEVKGITVPNLPADPAFPASEALVPRPAVVPLRMKWCG